MTETKKKLEKLEIHLREIAFDDVVYACPMCEEQVAEDDIYCHYCGQKFVDVL